MRIRRRRHFSVWSLVYVVITALIAIGAINSQNNLLFLAFGMALAVLPVSGVIGGGMLMAVRVERRAPEVGEVGAPLRIHYRVRNRSRVLPLLATVVAEEPATAEAKGRVATWPAHMPPPAALAAHVRAGGEAMFIAAVTPTRRGLATFRAMSATTTFPFGISRKSVVFEPRPEDPSALCVIRPAVRPIRADALRGAIAAAEDGSTASQSPGRGDEFFGLREYAPGDSARVIAWRPSARVGQLVVRETISPSPARLWVALLFPSSVSDTLDEQAVSMVASLIAHASERGVEVGMAIPAAGVEVPPGAGARQPARLLDTLALLDIPKDPAVRTSIDLPSARSGRAPWVVVHAGSSRPVDRLSRATHFSAASPGLLLETERPTAIPMGLEEVAA